MAKASASKMTAARRPDLSATGSFVAVPQAFAAGAEGVRMAPKLECRTIYSPTSGLQTAFFTDRVLVDLAAVDPKSLDAAQIASDCDQMKTIIARDLGKVQECIVALQAGGDEGLANATRLAEEMRLTEDHFVSRGGGLLFLLVVAAAAVTAGGCATVNSNKTFKQPTTPKPAPPPKDGGPSDGGRQE